MARGRILAEGEGQAKRDSWMRVVLVVGKREGA